ncbi:iron chelate uptake ABC transporter family permease subunit [Pyruvatibacter sp.]|uniref:FecCD family ABC transporter permease n=1 Tax=Pyruvatibacter sp. TaxID=1981328 RepID=UPI0032643F47
MTLAVPIVRPAKANALKDALFLPLLALLAIAGAVAGLTSGSADLSLATLASELWGALTGARAENPVARTIILDVRGPRVVLGTAVGATLAVAGAVLQALFRNPLAEPSIIGVSAGAGAAAVATIALGGMVSFISVGILYILPVTAFLGGLVATLAVMTIARIGGQTPVLTMLLAGIAVTAIGSALMGLMMFISNDEQLRAINFWMLGSLGSATWAAIIPALILMGLMLAAVPMLTRNLNLILLGEREAASLGLSVDRFKNMAVVLVAAGVGAAVAVSGMIGFVGIVVPHLLRLVIGPDHRILLPASVLGGAALLLWADVAARNLAPPAELPIGILTALLGAPFFLWLLRRAGRDGAAW